MINIKLTNKPNKLNTEINRMKLSDSIMQIYIIKHLYLIKYIHLKKNSYWMT